MNTFDPWSLFSASSIAIDYGSLGGIGAGHGYTSQRFKDIDVWRLASAIDGTRISVTLDRQGILVDKVIKGVVKKVVVKVECIVLTSTNDQYYSKPVERRLFVQADGKAVVGVVGNESFFLQKDWRNLGIGKCALAYQVEAAHRLGFSYLITEAVGDAGNTERTGYAAWPAMGYDGLIPTSIWKDFPEEVLVSLGIDPKRPSKVSDLYATPQGREAWKTYGSGFSMKFVLDSREDKCKQLIELVKAKKP